MSFTAGDVMDRVAALMNDQDKAVYTYAVQLAYFNAAVDELNELIEQNNVAVSNQVSDTLTIIAGATSITNTTIPSLPSDLIEIQGVYERLAGTEDDFIIVTRCEFLPKVTQLTNELIWWAWINQAIQFVGANTDRDVQIDYISSRLSQASSELSAYTVINAKSFLSYRAAALCSSFIGENPTRSEELNAEAQLALDRFLGIDSKGRQSIYTRRRPFMAAYKVRGYL